MLFNQTIKSKNKHLYNPQFIWWRSVFSENEIIIQNPTRVDAIGKKWNKEQMKVSEQLTDTLKGINHQPTHEITTNLTLLCLFISLVFSFRKDTHS